MATQAIVATAITAVAAHVRMRYFCPLYAYTPISFPNLLIICAALFWRTVTIIEAIARARRAMDAKPQFRKEKIRPVIKMAASEVNIARPAPATPMQ